MTRIEKEYQWLIFFKPEMKPSFFVVDDDLVILDVGREILKG